MLAFGAITAALGGIAAYKHRKEIERTLQEIADQMDAWEESSEFLRTRTPLLHTVNPDPEGVEEAPAAENEPAESDLWTRPRRRRKKSPLRQSDSCTQTARPPSQKAGGGGISFQGGERTPVEITIQPAYQEPEAIRELLVEYTGMLLEQNPAFAGYLKQQNFAAELDNLQEKYGVPEGRLYLVRADGAPAGCVAMKKLDAQRCELKRLYIRPAFRGQGLARRLVERLLTDARSEGYQAMLLDTFPFLSGAIRLYRTLGFYEIPSYNNSPLDSLIYMRKDLCPACSFCG